MTCSSRERDLIRILRGLIGETVTIYTTSGGESGRGFTGVLIGITGDPVVRLITEIGPAPACALGSCCDQRRRRDDSDEDEDDEFEEEEENNRGRRNRINCNLRNTGAIVDIPVNRIAAVVQNTLR